MDKKQEFIKQISTKKLKKTTPEKFANLIESAFLLYQKIDIWTVNDITEFTALKNKLLANKDFRKRNKKDYKLVLNYCGYYYQFLIDYNKNSDVSCVKEDIRLKYQKDFQIICDFYSDKQIAEAFYRLFEFSKEKDVFIELDARATIIGVKHQNERLRFYADKNGIVKFSKLKLEPIDLGQISKDAFADCFHYLDLVNEYFETHKVEVSLNNSEAIEFVYHKKFGFGKILSKTDKTTSVLFDDFSETKLLQLDHPSYSIISKEDYINKIKSGTTKQARVQNNSDAERKTALKRITWDKYEASLLIEAFWKIENKISSRVDVVPALSIALRKKAKNQGIDIDDAFRNENGISMQLSNIAKAFFPDRPAMHRTAIFDEIAEIYKTDKKHFNKLLEEAHALIEGCALSNGTKTVNWIDLENMIYTSPICVKYKGDTRYDFNSWAECYKYVLECLYKNYPEVFLDLAKNPSYTFLARNKTDLRRPLEIAERIYAEGNRSATEFVRSIKTFIDKCDFDYSDLVIEYADKNRSTDVPYQEPENKYVVAISEADFYTFIKQRYIDNHKIDGKAHRAPHHAQKCIDKIRAIGKLLKIDLFGLSKVSELSDIRVKLSAYKNDPDYTWYIYALGKFEDFISNNPVIKQSDPSVCLSEGIIDVYDYKTVLSDSFVDGYSFENPLRKKKFIHRYEELLNRSFEDSDELYLRKIRLAGFISENKVYLDSIVDVDLKSDIKSFIDDGLRQTSAIYYSAIYEAFNGRFNSLFSEDMLKNYLMFVFSSDYSFSSEYMTCVGAQVDLRKELIDVFMNCGRPMDIDEIYVSMPNISHSVIDSILRDKDFVVNYRGKSYFYKDVFVIDDEQLKQIDQFLCKQLATKEQITGSELYSFIITALSEVIDSNPGVTDLGIKNILKLTLEHKYNFRGDVISKLGQAIDVKTLYKDFCDQRERFSFSELEEFRNSINQNYIHWDAVMSSSIRISQSSFIRRDLVTFDVEKVDNAVASYCPKKYASFVDVVNYTDFPTLEVNWNAFVLESYLYMNSKKFKLIHATFNGDKPVGAIVNKNSNISGFDDLLVAIIRDNQLFEQEKAFAYLLENDYIRTRKVKNISSLIDRAKKEV